MRKGNDLGNDKILPLVLRLAVPSMLAQLVNVLYGIVDRMYIGNIPDIGETALAGRIRLATRIVMLGMSMPLVAQIADAVSSVLG